ncbi:hypothetical protein [Edaphobacter aggregans]|uniref:hypothetical protein n=1 Tax=Edaphobacter aggregans TaxID=570835 RepID=UPI001FE1E9CD|nr:hypothetical protein [Edaphobacter aggregans]
MKNGADIIVAQSILRRERLDRGAEFLDTAAQQFWSWRTAKPVAYAGDPQGAVVIKKNSLGSDPDFGFVGRLQTRRQLPRNRQITQRVVQDGPTSNCGRVTGITLLPVAPTGVTMPLGQLDLAIETASN